MLGGLLRESPRGEFFATRTVPTIIDEWIEKPTNMKNINTQNELQDRITELEAEISILKQQKKFGLVWEDKPEDVVTQCETHVPVLSEVKSKKISDTAQANENILIEGDNYHALSVLNYTHSKKIDVIYIDPPYNTGGDFIYNDKYIDKDDSFRHSKWISFMHKRLVIARRLLSESVLIFISIDDNEHATLKLLCDEVFSEFNFLGTITWEKRTKAQNTTTAKRMLQSKTEYVLAYRNSDKKVEFDLESAGNHEYNEEDKSGLYRLQKVEEMSAKGMRGRKTMSYSILGVSPRNEYQWKLGKEKIQFFLDRDDVEIVSDTPYLKIRPHDENSERFLPFWSHFFDKEGAGTAEKGKKELSKVLGHDNHNFETVKPVDLIKKILFHANRDKTTYVLDFFAGSGTLAQAVLELNTEDGGNRRFILCTNNENKIAEEVTYPRIKKVIKGYGETEGLGGALRYYKTKLVDVEKLQKIPDEKRLQLTYQAGEMSALREDTFEEQEKNEWWQIFATNEKTVAIYFQEDKQKLRELVKKVAKTKQAVLYVFSWSKNEYTNEFSEYKHIRVEDIPEPIIEVYKEINRLK